MAFNINIREIGECYARSRIELRLELRQSRMGVWELEVAEAGGGRRVARQFDDEPAARAAAEVAYGFGRRFGRWRIQRAVGYVPDPRTSASPVGMEDERDRQPT